MSSIKHLPALGTIKQGHHLLKCNYIVSKSTPSPKRDRVHKIYQKGNYELFSQYFKNINWKKEFDNKPINEVYDIFLFHYQYAIDEFIPNFDSEQHSEKSKTKEIG